MSEQSQAPALTPAPAPALTPAPVPAASPRARWWTILLGLVLLAAGGVAVHDLLVVRGTIHTDQLLIPVYDWIADVTYADWVLPAAIGCALVALILLVATRKRITVTATTAVGDQAERDAVSAAVSEQVGHLAAMLDPEPAVIVKIVASTPGGDRR